MLMKALTAAMILCAGFDTGAAAWKIMWNWESLKAHNVDLRGLYVKLILNLLVMIPLGDYLRLIW